MVWTHRFHVEAPPERWWEVVLDPERWFSFFPGYRGLDSVAAEWPAVGTEITVRYALAPGLVVRLRQRVTESERPRYLALVEETLGGLWRDTPRFELAACDGGTDVTLTVDPTSRWRIVRPVIALVSSGFEDVTPAAMQRLARMVEEADRASRRPPADGPSGAR